MRKIRIINKIVILYLAFIFLFPFIVRASSNIDNKDGNDFGGSSTGRAVWNTGDYGVRFTLVDKEGNIVPGTRTIDLFKQKRDKKNTYHTGGIDKLKYMKDKNKKVHLIEKGYKNYAYPFPGLWNVITTNEIGGKQTSSSVIKRKYFGDYSKGDKTDIRDTDFKRKLFKRMNINYKRDIEEEKDHYLIAEPILYIHLNGKYMAMTATEIAVYDDNHNNIIRRNFVSFSHKLLPLALYLERDFPLWQMKKYDGKVKIFSNYEIIHQMGIGIMLGGKNPPKPKPQPPKIKTFDYVYRCDTDVITTVEITANMEYNPESPLECTFYIPIKGSPKTITSQSYYVPKGYKQKVWVKWHTPKEPQDFYIKVTDNSGRVSKNINVKIDKLHTWEPLDPTANDKKPDNLNDFRLGFNADKAKQTAIKEKKKSSWTKWTIVEHQPRGDFKRWKEHRHYETIRLVGGGTRRVYSHSTYEAIWTDRPYYSFGKHEYSISTSPNGDMARYVVNGHSPTKPKTFTASIKEIKLFVVPAHTARKTNIKKGYIKSGYGIECDCIGSTTGNGLSQCTKIQNTRYFFPEFNYKKYFRNGVAEPITDKDRAYYSLNNSLNQFKMSLPKNWYSYTGYYGYSKGNYHFLPIWYPDGLYRVRANVYDMWTPDGELKTKLDGDITCEGAMWNDWHIRIVR